jgi:long-chain acyl-CoA synthetase
MTENVFSFLEEAAAKWGGREAIVEENESVTFGQLYEMALRTASLLVGACSLEGKGIGFVCSNGSRFVAGLFACVKAGGVVIPVLPGTRGSEVEDLFRNAGISLLMAEKGNRFLFSSSVQEHPLDENFDLYVFPGFLSSDIGQVFPGAAFVRPSSGTTGSSKGVVISHRAAFERTEAANDGLKMGTGTRVLWVLPMAFHFVVSILLYIRYGACMIVTGHFAAAALVSAANRFRATHLYASPLHYRLLAAEKGDGRFETLETAISTTALLEPAVSKKFFEKYHFPVSQAYGIIEIGLPFINAGHGNSRSESIGKALPRYKAAILDDAMLEVPSGTHGAFAISGPGMFSGYLWPLKRVEEVLVHSWFLTGDIAAMDSEGFVFIRGRSKSMINVSGNKVFPEEVEAVLRLHPSVAEARVYGGKHPVTGELVEADIVLVSAEVVSAEVIIAHCREHLLPYKVPQRVFFVNEIQKTNTGKVSRA